MDCVEASRLLRCITFGEQIGVCDDKRYAKKMGRRRGVRATVSGFAYLEKLGVNVPVQSSAKTLAQAVVSALNWSSKS